MLDIMRCLPHPNSVPCRWCADAGCGCGISLDGVSCWDLGKHSLRFMLHEPGWPVRLDMDGSWVPMGMNPAPAEDLPNGFLPAESDNTAEDTMHSVRAADELVAGLGLERAAGPWLDRVIVRIAPEVGSQAAICSAHTVVPYPVVAGHDPAWRGVEFGQVAVAGATVVVDDAWITTHRASAWDVEELAVLSGSAVNVVWLRLTLAFPSGTRLPSGLVVKLPPNRVVFGSPIPEQVRDQRVRGPCCGCLTTWCAPLLSVRCVT